MIWNLYEQRFFKINYGIEEKLSRGKIAVLQYDRILTREFKK